MSKFFPAKSVAAIINQCELDRYTGAIVSYVMSPGKRLLHTEFSEAFEACAAVLKQQHPVIDASSDEQVEVYPRGNNRLRGMATFR